MVSERAMKKGQMEIMGLVVIVLILVVALMFLIFFAARSGTTDVRKSFDDQQLAFNTVSSVLQVSTDCRDLRMQEVLQNCAWRNDLVCSGLPACAYAEKEIGVILDRILGYIQQDYVFYVFTSQEQDEDLISITQGRCEGDRTSSQFPIKYAGGEIFVGLDICDEV